MSLWNDEQINQFFEAFGGKENILLVENCTTRLRVVLKDMEYAFNQQDLMSLPDVKMVLKRSSEIQLVIGLNVFSLEKLIMEKLKS